MKQYDTYKSEGGYRVAREVVNGGPVITGSKWYETKRAAKCASNNMKRAKRALGKEVSMNTNKHTPGPWEVEGNAIVASKPFRTELEGGYPDTICEMNSSLSPESTTANAALISAAPELLQVAEDYVLLCKLHDQKGAVLDSALAAIRKARGEV
jgi:hypothetical protein